MIKTSEKHTLRDILQNNSPELLKTVRVIKNKTVYETTSTVTPWTLAGSYQKVRTNPSVHCSAKRMHSVLSPPFKARGR